MILLVLAFICFVLSALRGLFSPRVAAIDFVAIGLACWVLSSLWTPAIVPGVVAVSWPLVALVIAVLVIVILLVRQRAPKVQ